MHQTIEVSCTSLDLITHIVVYLHVKDICDEIQCILVVLDLSIESCEVESIREVVLIYLAIVLVTTSCNELDLISKDLSLLRCTARHQPQKSLTQSRQ